MQLPIIERKCQLDNHESSPILGICVDPSCQANNLFCVACRYAFHQNHFDKLKKFEELDNWIKDKQKITKELQKITDQLNQIVKNSQKLIESTNLCIDYQNSNINLDKQMPTLLNCWNQQEEMIQNLQMLLDTPIAQKLLKNNQDPPQVPYRQQLNTDLRPTFNRQNQDLQESQTKNLKINQTQFLQNAPTPSFPHQNNSPTFPKQHPTLYHQNTSSNLEQCVQKFSTQNAQYNNTQQDKK